MFQDLGSVRAGRRTHSTGHAKAMWGLLLFGLTASALMAALVAPGAADATAPKPAKVSCTSLSGSISASQPYNLDLWSLTVHGCTPVLNSGGSGTFSALVPSNGGEGVLAGVPPTITWNGAGTATLVFVATTPRSGHGKCPTGDLEVTFYGRGVKSQNPAGTGNGGVKGPMHAKTCANVSGDSISLLPGKGPFRF